MASTKAAQVLLDLLLELTPDEHVHVLKIHVRVLPRLLGGRTKEAVTDYCHIARSRFAADQHETTESDTAVRYDRLQAEAFVDEVMFFFATLRNLLIP